MLQAPGICNTFIFSFFYCPAPPRGGKMRAFFFYKKVEP